jgi:hypothetical protein
VSRDRIEYGHDRPPFNQRYGIINNDDMQPGFSRSLPKSKTRKELVIRRG